MVGNELEIDIDPSSQVKDLKQIVREDLEIVDGIIT